MEESVHFIHGPFHKKPFSGRESIFWNIAPRWKNVTPEKISEVTKVAYENSCSIANMVLWMPVSSFHKTDIDLISDVYGWITYGTILSGMGDQAKIGVLFGKKFYLPSEMEDKPIGFGYVHVVDGKGGPASSKTVRWLLTTLNLSPNTRIIDPWAHKSATLATWARRYGLKYKGWIRSKKSFKEATEKLNQVELPGTQEELTL